GGLTIFCAVPARLGKPAPPTKPLAVMNQIEFSPVPSFRHSRSYEPSPLKSPTPTICTVSGMSPKLKPPPTNAPPWINQTERLPLCWLRHRRSNVPSPLKSPVPTMATLSGIVPRYVEPAPIEPSGFRIQV